MIGKIALVLLFILLVWGNLVAGLKAGLACPDWPLCHGEVIPPFRWDIYVEFIHRVIGGITSIFIFILCYQRFKSYLGAIKMIPLLVVVLLVLQIVLGGIVVLMELPVDLTTFHFANAIVIFALVVYMVSYDGINNKPTFSISGYRGIFFLLSILIFVQAVLGAYVRHSSSGLACPDFPTCLGYWIPPEISGIVLNHFMHRGLAYLIALIFVILLIASYSSMVLSKYRNKLLILVGLIILQIGLGAAVVLTQLNYAFTALHFFIALLILTIALYTWFQGMKQSRV
ncbi:MAG: cytochrome oxidase assembly protein [Thermodesulfobacteriota bacterium]|nr:MAG: cytochrome oxidase assembly protein [Thermodesulfobacteriota bacterium]